MGGENLPDAWLPQPFNDVNEDPSPLNEEHCVIMLGSSEVPCQAVKAVAQEFFVAAGNDVDGMPMRFFSAPDGGVSSQLRTLTGVSDDRLILLDIPSDGAFYVCEVAAADLDASAVKTFISDFRAGKLERKQLRK